MVVFTCNNCGETLQKPRVAKHYQFQCRTAAFLTCVDCFKDFRGQEYVAHTKCITEAQRYGGKDYVPKANSNKGEKKQQEWINVVNNLLNSSTVLTNAERTFLDSLSKFENIPRKKAKFLNFIRSALGHRTNMAIVESVWSKMEAAHKNNVQNVTESEESGKTKEEENSVKSTNESFSKQNHENNVAENQNNENIYREIQSDEQHNKDESTNGDTNAKKVEKSERKKSKKRTISETVEEEKEQPVSKRKNKNSAVLLESSTNQIEDAVEQVTFDWKNAVLNIVQTKGEISIKKLQKKVVSQYMKHGSDTVTYEKACSKFHKKLKKVPEVVISDEKVKLA